MQKCFRRRIQADADDVNNNNNNNITIKFTGVPPYIKGYFCVNPFRIKLKLLILFGLSLMLIANFMLKEETLLWQLTIIFYSRHVTDLPSRQCFDILIKQKVDLCHPSSVALGVGLRFKNWSVFNTVTSTV